MDLTKSYPASVREQMHGIVQLKRTIDKGKALAAGTIGEYDYDCPMDKHLFEFLDLDGDTLLDVIKSASNDGEISEFVAPYVHAKDDSEIETFNRDWLKHGARAGFDGRGVLPQTAQRSRAGSHRRYVVGRSARPRREALRPAPRRRITIRFANRALGFAQPLKVSADLSRRRRVRRHELLRFAVSA